MVNGESSSEAQNAFHSAAKVPKVLAQAESGQCDWLAWRFFPRSRLLSQARNERCCRRYRLLGTVYSVVSVGGVGVGEWERMQCSMYNRLFSLFFSAVLYLEGPYRPAYWR